MRRVIDFLRQRPVGVFLAIVAIVLVAGVATDLLWLSIPAGVVLWLWLLGRICRGQQGGWAEWLECLELLLYM